MGIYLMSRKKFMEIISTAYERGGYDFLIDGILRHQDNLNIYGFQHEVMYLKSALQFPISKLIWIC